MDFVVYAVALLLLVSVALFVKAALFDRRPQKFGLIQALLAIPLFLIYYDDRWPFPGELRMRELVAPLDNIRSADPTFESGLAPAFIIGVVVLVHMTVFQRIAVRRRLQRVHDPIANFFAGTTVVTLVGGILVSTFHWGWVGAIIYAIVAALVYLGALALLAAFIEIFVEVSKLLSVWIKRKVFTIATWITRIASWVSSLSGRLVSRALIERIRADTLQQENKFLEEQEAQDRKLIEAYMRDRARRRRLMQRRGLVGDGEADAAALAELGLTLPVQDPGPDSRTAQTQAMDGGAAAEPVEPRAEHP